MNYVHMVIHIHIMECCREVNKYEQNSIIHIVYELYRHFSYNKFQRTHMMSATSREVLNI